MRVRESIPWRLTATEAICAAAVRTAIDINLKLIIVITDTGSTAPAVARFRPPMPILTVSMNQATINQMNIVRGSITLKVPSYEGTENLLKYAIDVAKTKGLVESGDTVVAIHGKNEGDVNRANTMKIIEVDDDE